MIEIARVKGYLLRIGPRLLHALILLLTITLVGCTLLSSSEDEEVSDDELKETEIAISVQQTMVARQETDVVETDAAGQVVPEAEVQPTLPPTPDMAATQAAMQPTPIAPQATSTQPGPSADFEAQMKSAKILLYEDIINNPEVYRYVKRTLDKMELPYTDVGSAKGRFKDALLMGTQGGQPWDLIIVAAESREGIQGEFFEYFNDSLDKGSSMIIEAYHLDEIYNGKASLILNRCGINVRNYAGKNRLPSDIMIFPVNDPGHPILNQPNSGISFTEGLTFFWDYKDLGSLMDIKNPGDTLFLLARTPQDTTQNAVLAVCDNNKLILQTFSSHSFVEEIMQRLWENYIYFALKVRLQGSP
jgi:hypothetical protein